MAKWRVLATLSSLCGWAVQAGAIQLADPVTFDADTLAVFPAGRSVRTIAFAPRESAQFPAFLYAATYAQAAATGLLHTIGEDGTIQDLPGSAHDDLRLYFGDPGMDVELFGADSGYPNSFVDGVYSVGGSGASTLVSNLGGGNPDCSCVLYGGGVGAPFGDHLYAFLPNQGAADPLYDDSIVRLNRDGTLVDVLAVDTAGPLRATLSQGGDFGDFLYYGRLDDSEVWRVSPSGVSEPFTDLSPFGVLGHDFDFARGDAFGADLYAIAVTATSSCIVRINSEGDVTLFAEDLVATDMAFDPSTGNMYVAEGTRLNVLRIFPQSVSGAPTLEAWHDIRIAAEPNPFREQTALSFQFPEGTKQLTLSIFDGSGRRVHRFGDVLRAAPGRSSLNWSPNSYQEIPGGVYFARLQADGKSKTIRLIRVR